MPKKEAKVHQLSPRVLACRENGRKGGLARAKNKTVAERKAWSSKGGKTTAKEHGTEFHSHIAGMRKTVGRYSKVVPVKRKKITA